MQRLGLNHHTYGPRGAWAQVLISIHISWLRMSHEQLCAAAERLPRKASHIPSQPRSYGLPVTLRITQEQHGSI